MCPTRLELMHDDIIVAELFLTDEGHVSSIHILDRDHMPWGTIGGSEEGTLHLFDKWWSYRCISSKRARLKETLDWYGQPSPEMLMVASNATNLSDHYWVRRAEDDLKWDDISLFSNDFSEDFGRTLLYGGDSPFSQSPDCTTDGVVPKMWLSDRTLIKGGTGRFEQEPFNEVIGSEVLKRLGLDHITYEMTDSVTPMCSCHCICGEDVEMIATRCIMYFEPLNGCTVFQHLHRMCERIGLENTQDFIDRMLVYDYIMANVDRHYNNFCILRNPHTLEVLGFAPLFDSGSSLGFDVPTEDIPIMDVTSRTFKKTMEKQLPLISSFDWLDLSALDSIEDTISRTMSGHGSHISEERVETICEFMRSRIDSLESYIESPSGFIDDLIDDIDR